VQRATRLALCGLELLVLSALVVTTRCANWRDVFIDGGIYFTDADCYARMTRAQLCYENPGTIIRHHEFENFPAGITPHTTAPFDYAIVLLAACLRPLTANPLDLAGALVSPLIALVGGWFLWWWMRRMGFAWRFVGLLLYATSPIIIHATELGRPDHQSLALVLVLIAASAEWSLRVQPSRSGSILAGAAWAGAIWVSAYEPLLLFLIAALCSLRMKFRRERWIVFGSIVAVALLVERRAFVLPEVWRNQQVKNWLTTIGELSPVPLLSATWLEWCGLFALVAPLLIALGFRRRANPPTVILLLLGVSFAATLFEARWGYFCAALLAIALPSLFAIVRSKIVAVVFALVGFAPILSGWDRALWPNESLLAARAEHRAEMRDVRAASQAMITSGPTAFIAPWWLSPAIAYWSGNNGVAGSSHESIDGIVDAARFYLATDGEQARAILQQRRVQWVLAYDAGRVAKNAATILGFAVPPGSLAFTLGRTPSRAPGFLRPAYQNGTCTLFSVNNSQ